MIWFWANQYYELIQQNYFFKKDDGSVAKVSGGGGGPDFKYLALRNAANNGAASYPNADFTLVTSGTTTAITPTAANTLLVSVNGVIQKPKHRYIYTFFWFCVKWIYYKIWS